MKVKDVMSSDVAYVSPDTPVTEIARIMKEKNIGSVPVCENKRAVGIVTDRDIVIRDVAMGKGLNNVKARDVMSTGLSVTTPETDIHEAAKMMADKQIRRLPVVDNGKLVGILAIGDLAVREKLEDNAGEALSDISKPTHTLL
ncbi:CBS domain-containing protein [Fonticella tunisiensis]|uniref:CBS domain-containing protein n=1 Tax=Fonticella tunisiensis TaxID=1096341 RepID=A0A4R7KP45_9CLOT|nr:CBS domain-containing protein [Fonticella tunisiensis]TDT60889.1 CBS domain-containing protein [Fonticella tunisiensis]